jgi:hypothetical protein
MSHIPLLKRSTLSNKINLMRQLNNATLVLESVEALALITYYYAFRRQLTYYLLY